MKTFKEAVFAQSTSWNSMNLRQGTVFCQRS